MIGFLAKIYTSTTLPSLRSSSPFSAIQVPPQRPPWTLLILDQLIQLTSLRWIDEFFTICPDDLLPFTPKLLEKVLPSLAQSSTSLDQAAHRVNEGLSNLILSVPQTPAPPPVQPPTKPTPRVGSISGASGASATSTDEKDSALASKETQGDVPSDPFDYYATVNSLTLQFLNEHEETRVAAFDWLIMLHKKAPNRVPLPHQVVKNSLVDGRF
jgi:hypothetical protein